MYKLLSARTTSDPLMLLLQGPPASGKTTAALTFPNPVVANFDRGLTTATVEGLQQIPFYDDNFCVKTLGWAKHNEKGIVNKRDGFKKWLATEAMKIEPDQTFILDSWSALQSAEELQSRVAEIHMTKGNPPTINEREPWALKLEFSKDVMSLMQNMRCNVVVIAHDRNTVNEQGELTDRVSPLQDGQFKFMISRFFSDIYRQHCVSSKLPNGKPMVINGVELTGDYNYFWQVRSNNTFLAKSRYTYASTLVPATYKSIPINNLPVSATNTGVKPSQSSK